MPAIGLAEMLVMRQQYEKLISQTITRFEGETARLDAAKNALHRAAIDYTAAVRAHGAESDRVRELQRDLASLDADIERERAAEKTAEHAS